MERHLFVVRLWTCGFTFCVNQLKIPLQIIVDCGLDTRVKEAVKKKIILLNYFFNLINIIFQINGN